MSLSRTGSLLLVLLLAAAPTLAQSSVFTAEDMLDLVSIAPGSLSLAPTGERLAYVLPDMSDEWNVLERNVVGYVHVQNLGPERVEAPRALTQGATRSSFPVWSPDGKRLALFVEEPQGGQLAVWDPGTNRIDRIGERFSGRAYLPPQWDPSGERVFYAAAVRSEDPGEPPRVRIVKSSDRRIPGDDFFLDDRRARIAAVDLPSGEETILFDEPRHVRSFLLSPAGDRILFSVPSPDTFGVIGEEKNETFLIPAAGGEERKLAANGERLSWMPDGTAALYVRDGKMLRVPLEGGEPEPLLPDLEIEVTQPVWSPDGAQFVTLSPDDSITDPEIEPPQPGMYTIARPFMDLHLVTVASGEAKNLTSSFEDQVADPVWSPGGDAVFFRTIDNQTYDEKILRHALAEAAPRVLTEGEESYGSLRAAERRLVFTAESANAPEDLWLVEPNSGERRRVTTLNPQLARFRFGEPELFHFYNADGERLAALLYRPPGLEPGEKVPVITYVYEKLTPGIHRFSPPHQIFLTHGYAVLMPNVKVKVGQTATSFVKSVVPAVNALRAMGIANGKFALWGGSFGAYATAYVVTQTNVFDCAVARATPPELFRNWASGRDRDSNNIERGQARMGGSPFEYMERYLTQSAFFQLDKVETPLLIMHGVEDYTILFGEGEMLFYALRRLGKEATFVIYTHGDHSLSRHSRSDTLDVYRRMLDWFDEHLR